MTYDTWPDTSVPVKQATTAYDCEDCDPGHGVLTGPGRRVMNSHVFTVHSRPVVLRGVGLRAFKDATVTLEMELRSCGDIIFEPVSIDGIVCCLSHLNNVMTVTGSGRYRVVLAGADPEDVWVTQHATDTAMVMGTPTLRTGPPQRLAFGGVAG